MPTAAAVFPAVVVGLGGGGGGAGGVTAQRSEVAVGRGTAHGTAHGTAQTHCKAVEAQDGAARAAGGPRRRQEQAGQDVIGEVQQVVAAGRRGRGGRQLHQVVAVVRR